MKTTVVGSFPYKTDVPNWFKKIKNHSETTLSYNEYLKNETKESRDKLQIQFKDVLEMNQKSGLNIITNGEIDRENYIHFFMRNWEGVDFENQE